MRRRIHVCLCNSLLCKQEERERASERERAERDRRDRGEEREENECISSFFDHCAASRNLNTTTYTLNPKLNPKLNHKSSFEHLFFLRQLLASSNLSPRLKLNPNPQHLTLFASSCSSCDNCSATWSHTSDSSSDTVLIIDRRSWS